MFNHKNIQLNHTAKVLVCLAFADLNSQKSREGRRPGIHIFVGKYKKQLTCCLFLSLSLSLFLFVFITSLSLLISPTHTYTYTQKRTYYSSIVLFSCLAHISVQSRSLAFFPGTLSQAPTLSVKSPLALLCPLKGIAN